MSSLYFRFAMHGLIAPQPNPLLDKLLARASPGPRVSDWRQDAFHSIVPQVHSMPGEAANAGVAGAGAAAGMPGVASLPGVAGMPAVAAVALYASRGPLEEGWVCVATPVHYLAEMSNVRLARNGILALSREQVESLALDFNRIWCDSGIRLQVGQFGELLCIFDRALQVATRDPEDVLDRHIEEYLPHGADAGLLRRLMSEVEMWLFEHAVNRARCSEGMLAINGLWLWGGGAVVASLPKVQGGAVGEDVFFNYFRGEVSGGGVIVAPSPGSSEWQHAQSCWLEPAIVGLRTGRIAKLILSAGDRCFSLTARGLRRFWRRPRPWWERFA